MEELDNCLTTKYANSMKTKKELLKLLIGNMSPSERIELLWSLVNAANDDAILDYYDITDSIGPS